MKVSSFLRKWYDTTMEDYGGITSPMYKEFEKDYKNVLREIAKEINFTLYRFNGNHYQFSVVFKDNETERYFYMSISDTRYFKNEWADDILYRTMAHESDYSGGTNRRTTLKDLKENLINLKNKEV